MNEQTPVVSNHNNTLVEDVRALMAATTHLAGEEIEEARKRLSDALDSGSKIFGRVEEKAAEGLRCTHEVVRANPYKSMAVALGVGAVVGHLISNR